MIAVCSPYFRESKKKCKHFVDFQWYKYKSLSYLPVKVIIFKILLKPQNLEDDDDDNLSTISNLSDLMEESWRPTAGPMMWIQTQMMMGTKPREILSELIPDTAGIPDDIDDLTLWKIIINIKSEPERRNKLKNYNTLDDAIQLLQTRENIIVLTGAGVCIH